MYSPFHQYAHNTSYSYYHIKDALTEPNILSIDNSNRTKGPPHICVAAPKLSNNKLSY